MTTLVLVEAAPAELEVRPGDTIVALTPRACAELRRRGIPFETLGDRCEDRFAAVAPKFWDDELAWFDALDEALAELLPEVAGRELRPALLYGYFLKGFVDAVYVRGVELAALLDGYPATGVVLYREEAVEPSLDWTLTFLGGPSVLSRLLPLFAAARGLEFEERPIPRRAPAVSAVGSSMPAFIALARRIARAGIQVCEAAVGLARRAVVRKRRLKVLLTSRYYDSNQLLHEAIRRGHRCLIRMEDGRIVERSRFRTRVAGTVRASGEADGFSAAAAAIAAAGNPLWDWPNGWFGAPVGVSEILAGRIRYWIAEILPELFELSGQWLEFLERERVDFVVVPHLFKLDDFALTDATRLSRETKAVQIEHGDSALALVVWDLLDLFDFDQHFAPSAEFAGYLEARAARYERPTASAHVGSYRWRENARRAGRRGTPPEPIDNSRPLVVYALGLAPGDWRYMNSDWSPDVWYYELETSIIESMSRDERYTFVIKTFPGEGHIDVPIAEFVQELGVPHVHVSSRRFTDWLPAADRVVVDTASTAIYETALARVPLLSLVNERLDVRSGAAEMLGPSLAGFRTIDDALERVRVFLDDADPFVPTLSLEGRDILTTLEELKQASSKIT